MSDKNGKSAVRKIEWGVIATLSLALLGGVWKFAQEFAQLETRLEERTLDPREMDRIRISLATLEADMPRVQEQIVGLRSSMRTLERIVNGENSKTTQEQDYGKAPPDTNALLVSKYYSPSGKMGDIGDVTVSGGEDQAHRFIYRVKGMGPHEWEYKYVNGEINEGPAQFAGVMWLSPPNEWGIVPDGGYDLRQFRGKMSWEARSLRGDAKIEFVMGGVTWIWRDGGNGKWARTPAPYPDSLPRISLGVKTLTKEWRSFEFFLDEHREDDFKRVVGVFGWIATWANNGVQSGAVEGDPREIVLELRNLRLEREVKK